MTRILFAEDEHDIRELIRLTLQFGGYEVLPARDGQEAVDLAATAPIDLILLDVRMPRLTGYEACRQIKAMDGLEEVPVIFLTAKGQDREVQKGLASGAAAYVLKPFAPDDLLRKIEEIRNRQGSGAR